MTYSCGHCDPETLDLLANKAADGDECAREALGRLLPRFFHSFLQRHAENHQYGDREDMAQEGCRRVFAALDTFDPDRGPFIAWIVTIAKNLVSDDCRKKRQSKERQGLPPVQPTSTERGPLDEAVHQEIRRELTNALAKLTPSSRGVIALRVNRFVSAEAVAHMFDMTRNTVDKSKSRAIKRLKKHMESFQ